MSKRIGGRHHKSRATRVSSRRAGRQPCRLFLEALEQRCLLSAASAYGQLPLVFEANQGQAAAEVDFVARGSGYALSLTPTAAALSLSAAASVGQPGPAEVLRMRLVGANPSSQTLGQDLLPGVVNYLIGNDASKWITNIPTFGQVADENVYAGVNLVYQGSQGRLEYEFVINPGAHVGVIRMAVTGAQSMTLDGQGDLVLHAPGGDVTEEAPILYQQIDGAKRAVAGRYVLQDNSTVGFAVGAYNASLPLVIDPTLSYSTYLGGSDDQVATGIAVDSAGEAFIVGNTASTDFPTAAPLQGHNGGGRADAFVTKLNAAGSALVYSTYLGGSGNDTGNKVAVDAAGDAYVIGSTNSTNFPTVNAFQATDKAGSIGTAFVSKLNATGTALVYSTYLGGSGNPAVGGDSGYGIAVDSSGSAYVTGRTLSSNFPTANSLYPTYQAGNNGEAFVTKFSPSGTTLSYSTYLGGSLANSGGAITVDSAGAAYVTGFTDSTNFPTAGTPVQATAGGNGDAFVTKFSPSGGSLVYSTYLGGSDDDEGSGIAVDAAGDAYVAGATASTNFPTANALQKTNGGGFDAFVTELNASGSAFVYSTYLGGSGSDYGNAIAVDAGGTAFVAGETGSSSFPIVNAIQPVLGGGFDGFVAEMARGGGSLVYSTYLGGSGFDRAGGIALDGSDSAYVTGSTGSTNFPTLNPYQPTNPPPTNGNQDAFVVKILSHAWHTVDVAVSGSERAEVLWDKIDGSVDVWSVTDNLVANPGAAYGPLSGWTAIATAAGSDSFTRVLFTDSDGSTALWLARSDGMLAGTHVFAPMTGWSAQDVTVGSDGNTRLLWTNTSGAMMIWSLDDNFNVVSNSAYGPFSGWTAKSIAAGGDGLIRVLWNNANGQAAVWLLNANGSLASAGVFGPIGGWTAVDVAVGPDNETRILWDNVNGAAAIWSVNSSFAVVSSSAYGPFAGWTAELLADGSDGIVRLVWDNSDGHMALWLLDASGDYLKSAVYGPF